MSNADKTTIKLPAHPGKEAAQDNLTEDQNNALELVKKTAQLQEEKNRSLEMQMIIEQLQESLKEEQAKSAGMAERAVMLEAKVKELTEQGANVKQVADLEAKVKELTELLGKISGIAATGRAA
jgi:hypothetical protein